jgi:hypothetical protein
MIPLSAEECISYKFFTISSTVSLFHKAIERYAKILCQILLINIKTA